MKKWVIHIGCLICLLLSNTAIAADLRGIWQSEDEDTARYALKFQSTPKREWTGQFYVLGKDAAPQDIYNITFDGQKVSLIAAVRANQRSGAFHGNLSADGNTIIGTWDQGNKSATFKRVAPKDAWVTDPTAHKVSFVTVQPGVKLEVLDWGGSGPPMIFLPGLGNTAHVFDGFAPKFTDRHHVYGITRRGLGSSSAPPPTDENYEANRLGDDVLAVMAALDIRRPVLVGHSMGGEELSSVATRFPDKIAGVIYLDAAYSYAYYDTNGDTLTVDVDVIRRDLMQLPAAGVSPIRSRALIDEIQMMLPNLQRSLSNYRDRLEGLPEYPPIPQIPPRAAMDAIDGGNRRFGAIPVPTLAIFASPPACQPACDTAGAKAYAHTQELQVNAFAAGNPNAKVVRLPYANHYVFLSNEADVAREMAAFLSGLDAR